jgi:hypothetical protein
MAMWWLYLCEKKGRFYVGITTDLDNRLRQHGGPPLLYKGGPLTREEAVFGSERSRVGVEPRNYSSSPMGHQNESELALSGAEGSLARGAKDL